MPRLVKALGQHHLLGGHLCRPALEFLHRGLDPVVEIGPGGGVLTAELLAAGHRVVAWELDAAWAQELRRRLPSERLSVVVGDALDIPWSLVPPRSQAAGNLPYQVATQIIQRLLPHHQRVLRAAFLVQKEVGERLVARPGDAAYGALSVLVAARSRIHWLGRVRQGSFRPPPKVEGAFIGLELLPPPLPEDEMEIFEDTVRQAFAQRRKTLRNSLAGGWGREAAEARLAKAGLDGGRRAETLDLADFLGLTRARLEDG